MCSTNLCSLPFQRGIFFSSQILNTPNLIIRVHGENSNKECSNAEHSDPRYHDGSGMENHSNEDLTEFAFSILNNRDGVNVAKTFFSSPPSFDLAVQGLVGGLV